jgi:hypothetical protein
LTEWSCNGCGFIMTSKFPNRSKCAFAVRRAVDHFREGWPPCRPIFLLVSLLWSVELISRTARRPSLPWKTSSLAKPCPLTSEIPLRLHRDLRGHRARLLPTFNRTPDIAFEDGSRPLWRTLKNRERMRSVIPELLPRAEMGRAEGTGETE